MHVFFEFPGKKRYQVEFSHFKVLPPQILLKILASASAYLLEIAYPA